MINQERIKNLLLEFVQIDSHSRKERDIAERIKKYCEEMGAQAEIDDAVARLAVWRALLAAAKLQGDLKPFLEQVAKTPIKGTQ